MAGYMTTSNHSDFIPEIVFNQALGYLRGNIILAKNVVRDSDLNGQFEKGHILNITKRGVLTAEQKTETGDIVLQNPNGSSIQVPLDQYWHTAFSLTSLLKAEQSIMDLEGGYIRDALDVLVEQIETSLFNLYPTATNAVGAAGAAIDESVLLDADEMMNDNKAPKAGRIMAVSNKDNRVLLQTDRITKYEAVGTGSKIIEGAIGMAAGFNIMPTSLAPSVAGAPVTTHNLAFTRSGIILASRRLPQIRGADSFEMIDPETGIIFRVTIGYNSAKNQDQVVIEALWGCAIQRQEFVVHVIS